MSSVLLEAPLFLEPHSDRPISQGYVFVGQVNQNAANTDGTVNLAAANAITIIDSSGVSMSVSQPLRTTSGGYASYNGTPVCINVSGEYSITVLRNDLSQAYYAPKQGTPSGTSGVDVAAIIAAVQATEDFYADTATIIASGSLNFAYSTGYYTDANGASQQVAGGAVAVPNNTTSFIVLRANGQIVATQSPIDTDIQLYSVTALAGSITSITDLRSPYRHSAFPPNYLEGFAISYVNATTLQIAAGSARNSTDVHNIASASAFTKTTANYADGTGNGGMPSGFLAANTSYTVFAIGRDDGGTDFYFDTAAASIPAGWTYQAAIGSFSTNAADTNIDQNSIRSNINTWEPVIYGDAGAKRIKTAALGIAAGTNPLARFNIPPAANGSTIDYPINVPSGTYTVALTCEGQVNVSSERVQLLVNGTAAVTVGPSTATITTSGTATITDTDAVVLRIDGSGGPAAGTPAVGSTANNAQFRSDSKFFFSAVGSSPAAVIQL